MANLQPRGRTAIIAATTTTLLAISITLLLRGLPWHTTTNISDIAAIQQQIRDIQKIPHETLQRVILSELNHQSHEESLAIFHAETEYAWEEYINIHATTTTTTTTTSSDDNNARTFLICHTGPDQSGYQRRQDFLRKYVYSSSTSTSTATSSIYYDDDERGATSMSMPMPTVYNGNDMTCFLLQMDDMERVAHLSSSSDISVQLLTSHMKIGLGTVDQILNGASLGLYVQLCEFVSRDDANIRTRKEMVMDRASDVLARLYKDENANDGAENQRFRDLLAVMAHHYPRAGTIWRSALEEEGGCPASHFNDDDSHLEFYDYFELEYAAGFTFALNNNAPLSPACLLSVVAGLSVQPEICHVDTIAQVELFNTEAQWIVQSAKPDYRPFWDQGLDGRDQVVNVVDAEGLDIFNCYFRDEKDTSTVDMRDGVSSLTEISNTNTRLNDCWIDFCIC